MQASSGYHEHWPQGRGIFVRDDKKFLNWINEGDHIRIISMEMGSDVKAVFNRLGQGACLVEDGIRKIAGKDDVEPVFMFHPKLGSVTCCVSNWRRIGFWEYELVTDMIVCSNHLAKLEEEL